MTLKPHIRKALENWAGEALSEVRTLSGGCIAEAYRVRFVSGKDCFLKTGADDPATFAKEANGLRELQKAGALRVPQVYLADSEYLLLEFLSQRTPRKDFYESFGRKFAEMHRYTGDTFGFYEDNFIGATPQKNRPTPQTARDWPAFFFQHRLLFQFKLAEHNGYATAEMRRAFEWLEEKIADILAGSAEPPSLLHGDLWGGNYLVDERGDPCLIDPAVYYGHREADLAMTSLFGRFDERFYAAYRESYPLPAGYEYRENVYQLYHVMNHLNLFGRSYFGQAMALLRSYR